MSEGTEIDVLEKLRGGEVALKLTHGEGEGYFAFVDGELHHHRAHPSVPSAGAGEAARERFDLDAGLMAMFEPEYIPLDESPFAEVN